MSQTERALPPPGAFALVLEALALQGQGRRCALLGPRAGEGGGHAVYQGKGAMTCPGTVFLRVEAWV